MRKRRIKNDKKTNWLVDLIGIAVILACMLMLVAVDHALPSIRFPVRLASGPTLAQPAPLHGVTSARHTTP